MPTELGMAAGTAANTIFGLMLQGHNDRRQLRQQKKLNEQQLMFDRQKMDYQQQLGLELWRQTNYPAQIEQLKAAGLNPALLYGMGGAGGATVGGAGGGISAPGAPAGGNEILGLQMLGAQKALIEAQTEKTQAEAGKIKGVDTEEAQTRIASLTQGIQNQKAAERLTKIQGNIAEIEELIQTGSYEDVISTIHYTARQAHQTLGILTNEREISDATKDEKVHLVEGELIGLGLANELKRAGIALTEEQTKKVTADVAQGWKALSIQDRNAIANMMNSETAKQNARTNVREYLESVRRTDYDYEVRRGMLELQRFIKDVPESTQLTVGNLTSIFRNILR